MTPKALITMVTYLAVDDGDCDMKLRGVVREHDDGMRMRNGLHELIKGDGEVRHHEEEGADTAAQLRPLPQVLRRT